MVVEQIEKVLIETLDEMSIPVDSMRVILSNRKDLCDYQCDDAFKLAKLFHKSPLSIAEEIVEKLKEREDFSNYFEKVEGAISPSNDFLRLWWTKCCKTSSCWTYANRDYWRVYQTNFCLCRI